MSQDHQGKYFQSGERQCRKCGTNLPAFEHWPGRKVLWCGDCAKEVSPGGQTQFVGDGRPCERPNCQRFAPSGFYDFRVKNFMCSIECYRYMRSKPHLLTCCHCKIQFRGKKPRQFDYQFCSHNHWARFHENEHAKRSGIFLPLFNEYIEGDAKRRFRSLAAIRSSLPHFFEFLCLAGIVDLNDVSPKTITEYLDWSRKTGRKYLEGAISMVCTFLNWAIIQGHYKHANPVIPRFHYKQKPMRLPRPYSDTEVDYIWALLNERGSVLTKLTVAIGQETGLRAGEIANLRLSDVDLVKQQLFVRLPNKTSQEDFVPFHRLTKEYLELWLRERNPECKHDHLLHSTRLKRFCNSTLYNEVAKVLCKTLHGKELNKEGMDKFALHKLRHTMATRLMTNGANAATIMKTGRWRSARAMSGYTKIDAEVARRGFQEAMDRADAPQVSAQMESKPFTKYLKQEGAVA